LLDGAKALCAGASVGGDLFLHIRQPGSNAAVGVEVDDAEKAEAAGTR
jgi:hypothetical protein